MSIGTTLGLKNLNNLAGGLASSAVSFAFTGNATFNILNLTDFGSRINGGLLELTVGKDGISSKIGNGGTNISYSNIKSSISGASSLHKNSQINNTKYDKQTKDALRSQWGFGDKTAKKQLDSIINGDTVLKFDAEGSKVAQSITENGQKVIHINSSQNEGFIDLGLTLQHEAHRDGIISDEQSQYIETVNAVAGHTQMALAMAIDKLYTKDMLNHISSDTNLQNDINAYMYAAYTGNTGLFADYVGSNYDSSADYWKLVQREDGSLGWAWDGDFDFNINGIGKISAEKMKAYSNTYEAILDGETVITDGSITSEKMALNTIAVLFNEAGNNSFMQFISETEGFADASIAAKMLESGNLSQENINAMNAGLYAAQRSGLLVKNDYSAIMANGLVGSGTIDNPYLPLTGNVLVTCLAGYRFVTEDFYNSLKEDSRTNFPLNEFAKNIHLHTDIISDNFNIVTSVEGAVKLNYDDTWGLNGTNYSSDGYMAFLSNHMDPSSIKNYVALFGMEGTNINQANNGSYYMNGIKAGSVYGQMGQTGISGGKHVDFGIYQTNNPYRLSLYNDTRIDFESIFKIKNKDNKNGYEYTIDTWARYYSGMPTDNIFDNYPSINNYLLNWTIKNVPNYSTLPYRG